MKLITPILLVAGLLGTPAPSNLETVYDRGKFEEEERACRHAGWLPPNRLYQMLAGSGA